jgi:hypothetical protein
MSTNGMKQMAIALGADPVKKVVILSFSGKVDRMEFTPDQALEFAKQIVSRSIIARGGLEPAATPPQQEN